MVSLVAGWHPLVEGARRLKGGEQVAPVFVGDGQRDRAARGAGSVLYRNTTRMVTEGGA
jgi:hypothetical protein